jgi:radical SAM superfamily enzyme YgiQ (UPF0313 family)
MYKDLKFERRSVEAVKGDIDRAKEFAGQAVETVFIGDSDSLVIETETVCRVLDHLCESFPSIKRVTSYARAQTLCRKSDKALKRIRQAGLTRLHIGLETGSGELLKRIRKGASPETMASGIRKARNAGFEISVYVLLGLGGVSNWEEHADGTAGLINRMAPDFVRVRTLVPQQGTQLHDQWREGRFKLSSPEGILREQRRLVEGIEVNCRYLSDHISNYAPVNGTLPGDKAGMLLVIDHTLERLAADETFRGDLERMAYLQRL